MVTACHECILALVVVDRVIAKSGSVRLSDHP